MCVGWYILARSNLSHSMYFVSRLPAIYSTSQELNVTMIFFLNAQETVKSRIRWMGTDVDLCSENYEKYESLKEHSCVASRYSPKLMPCRRGSLRDRRKILKS